MTKSNDPIVIVSAKRTAIGSMMGQFAQTPATALGAAAIQGLLTDTSIAVDEIDDVMMGCVLSAGCGQAPARQASLAAGIPQTVPCTTVNKMCGSGLQTVIMAHDRIAAGASDIVIAGGQENMSLAPYLLPKARQGYRFGHGQVVDHMLLDGLEDAYHSGTAMGYFAEKTAEKFAFTREQQDAYALSSLTRAQIAMTAGEFADEVVAVDVTSKKGTAVVIEDEGPSRMGAEKMPTLKPAFVDGGTVTAANASAISDGAAAVMLMRLSQAEKMGLTPLAKITDCHGVACAPEWFTTAPTAAIEGLLQKCSWQADDVDLFEINEAFAVVVMHALETLKLDPSRVNVRGGACVLGHPIGASGARILVTLLHSMKQHQLQRGIAAVCIGGGEGLAIAVERLN